MHWIALQPSPEAALADPHSAWAWWALHFTPLVARVEDTLVLEVHGSERLFGGRAALLAQFFKPNGPVAPAKHAQGATSLIALGRLWSASAASGTAQPADSLPLYTLAAARPHLPMLSRLGCTTWGQLRALPRGGLVRRFGAELVDALDRAYGQQPEVYPWLVLPDVFDMPLELSAAVDTAPALLFGARRLLAQLRLWLHARSSGVLALELLWELDARRSNARHVDSHHSGAGQGRLVLRTAQATQDMAHLQRLLGEQLARVALPAPVLYIRLRSLETQPLSGESASLLPDEARSGDSLHQMLERLGARLGPQQVQYTQLQADHRPERMQQWKPVQDQAFATKKGANGAITMRATGLKHAASQAQGALYPTWLLATPLKLAVHGQCPQYQGPLTLLAGPQRLEAGWLEGTPALRDYFVARSAQAGLLWVYCERLGRAAEPDGAWYLHGLFA